MATKQPTAAAPPRCPVCESILTRLRCELRLPEDEQHLAPRELEQRLGCIRGVLEGQIALLDRDVSDAQELTIVRDCFFEQIYLLEQCRDWLRSIGSAASAFRALVPTDGGAQ